MKNIEDSKGYPSLEPIISKKNVIILFSAITLLIIIGAILFYLNGVNQVYEDKRNELTAIEALKISQISLWRNERIADIKTVVHSEVLGERFAGWLSEPNNVVKKEAVFKLIKPLKDNYKYDQIFICSPDGKLLLSTDSSMSVIDSATYARVNEIKNTDSIGTPEFYYCSYHQKVHLDIIASLNSERNKHIGTVVFRIDPNLFLYPLIKWWPIPTKLQKP